MRDLNLTTGREVFGVALDAANVDDTVLRGRLVRSAEVALAGERRRVRLAVGRTTVRARFRDRVSVRDLPELLVDGRRFSLIVALDSLDPSRRAYLARKLQGEPVSGAVSLRDRIAALLGARAEAGPDRAQAPDPDGTQAPDPDGPDRLSPAARALYDRVEDAEANGAFDSLHLAAFGERGLEPVAAELVEAGLIVTLEKGHVIGIRAMGAKRQSLRELADPFTSREAAARWGCSHGRARAILGRLVLEGVLQRTEEGYAMTGMR